MPSQGGTREVRLSYRVDDIAAAVERARAAGGRAVEPQRRPFGLFGLFAECADDQGAPRSPTATPPALVCQSPADPGGRGRARGFTGGAGRSTNPF